MTRWWGIGGVGPALPLALLLTACFVVPMAMVFSLAFRPFDARVLMGTDFTLANLARFLGDWHYIEAFLRTLWLSALTAVICMVLAVPVAWNLHGMRSSLGRLAATMLVLTPLMVSLVVASFSWTLIIGGNGILNQVLEAAGLSRLRLMNTATGVVIVSVFSQLPYTILTTHAALESVDQQLWRAAIVHGARPARAFWRVILPLCLPGIVAGGLIVFALTMAAFVIPFLIGGGRILVAPLLIYQSTMQLFDWPGAAALGILLFALTLSCTWAVAALAQRLMPWERPR